MTIIYTDTHLTSDPVFNLKENSAIFYVALSSLQLECRIHREENINFLRHNHILTGDMVRIHGVFVTRTDQPHYIKVNYLSLINDDIIVSMGKKRKASEMMLEYKVEKTNKIISNGSPSSITPSIDTPFVEFKGDYSEYFFMLMGKMLFYKEALLNFDVTSIKDSPQVIVQNMIMNNQKKLSGLMEILSHIHGIYTRFMIQGCLDKQNVINFMNIAATFSASLTDLQKTCPVDFLPDYVEIDDTKIPLPSLIYNYYIELLE